MTTIKERSEEATVLQSPSIQRGSNFLQLRHNKADIRFSFIVLLLLDAALYL